MSDKPDPTKDNAFKKVVDYFLRTPPQPKPQPKRGTDSEKADKPGPRNRRKPAAKSAL